MSRSLQQSTRVSFALRLLVVALARLAGVLVDHRQVSGPARGIGISTDSASAADAAPLPHKRPFAEQRGLNVELVEARHIEVAVDAGEHVAVMQLPPLFDL